jgi:hypothetical protein
MIRKLIILWLSLSVISSILGTASKIAQRNEPESAQVKLLEDQVQSIEKDLDHSEQTKGLQPAIRAELAMVKAELSSLRDRHLKDLRFDWWADGIHPILMLLLLILFIKNKNLLAEQAAP